MRVKRCVALGKKVKMTIFDVLGLFCGLALFLYGMDAMGDALKKSAGRKLKIILGNLTSNKFKGFLLGLGVTAIIQSSSATTVMVVGFVTSGTMLLSQAVGVILGANVGTAVTAWLTALNSIPGGKESTSFLNFLKPDAWMPILAVIGIGLIMFAKTGKKKDIGAILMGFAVLMVGMTLMSDAVSGLKNDEGFRNLLTMFKNPILGILAGTALTAIVQSSSASVGILQALAIGTGSISFAAAMPIIMGQNIGTCVTAIISSLGANKNGKRAACVHLYFNVIGVILWMGLYGIIGLIIPFDLFGWMSGHMIDAWGIAGIHTIFKLFSVLALFPFTNGLVKLANLTVRGDDKKGDEYTAMLDERLLSTPTVAIERCRQVTFRMAELSADSLKKAMAIVESYDPKIAQEIRVLEDKVDIYEDVLGSYLVKLSARDMTEEESHEVSKLLHMIGDFERISDYSVNISDSAEEIKDKNISFSVNAQKELATIYEAVTEALDITNDAFVNNNFEKAYFVEPLEDVIGKIKETIKHNHVIRLQRNECSIELGFILSDILTTLERAAAHCSNVAGCLIEISHNSLEMHNFTQTQKTGEIYESKVKEYSKKYTVAAKKGDTSKPAAAN